MKSVRVHRGALSLTGAIAISFFAALATAASDNRTSERSEEHPAPTQSACGSLGLPPCPLQAWMRANVASQLASNNLKALAVGLEKAAKLSPDPSWNSWPKFASEGAAAARRGDVAGARASCKGCHDTWREAYKARFRPRPLPR